MKNKYFNICEKCGATLDPNERCTCEQDEKREQEQKKLNKMVELTASFIKQSKNRRKRK